MVSSMAAPYLVEVRTGGELKHCLRDIINNIADQFNVHAVAKPRAVPHITLFGPYNTNRGNEVKERLLNVYQEYDIVPYRVDGFDCFEENNVVYANVVPSRELQDLRRDISRELRPITYNVRPWDEDYFYDFHITVAFKDVGDKFEDIFAYVNDEYNPQFDEYATRITSLRRGDMMWEYDLLQDEILSSKEATSAKSWENTIELLEKQSSDNDYSQLAPKPGRVTQYAKYFAARLLGQW